MTKKKNCSCTVTQGREGEKGSWCVNCGKKYPEWFPKETEAFNKIQKDNV